MEEVATGKELFKATLDISSLENLGVTVDLVDDCDSGDWPDGKIVFWGGQGEKGCFFDGEVTLRTPFDPSKLRISYGNGDDWYISSGVEYDGEDVEGTDGYSTTGKWAEGKFWIAGGEAVYEGVERNEDGDTTDELDVPVLEGEEMQAQEAIDAEPDMWEGIPLSPWHPVSVRPDIPGQYDIMVPAPAWPFPQRAEWTGRTWRDLDGHKIKIQSWRGLSRST